MIETDQRTPGALAEADAYTAHNYHPLPVVIADAEGSWVTDVDGNRYLDFIGGINVNALGHSHPTFVRAGQEQVAAVSVGSPDLVQVIEDEKVEPFLLLAASRAHRNLRDGQVGLRIDVNRQRIKLIVGIPQQREITDRQVPRAAQVAIGDVPPADLVGDGGDCPLHQRLGSHFARPIQHAALVRPNTECDVHGKPAFAHAGASGADRQLAPMDSVGSAIEVHEPPCHAALVVRVALHGS